jgi:hypothetical protein
MAEGATTEIDSTQKPEVKIDVNKQSFLKASETSRMVLDGLNLDGFQLGGGAIDFSLGKYRRPHGDIDVVYIVDSVKWEDYVNNPKQVPDERASLQNVTQELELSGVVQTTPNEMTRLGSPGIRMSGGEIGLTADFVEGYKHTENNEEFIMLPIFEGNSFIKIPSSEIEEREIEGTKTKVPSKEVQYLIKEQSSDFRTTMQAGLPPDRREKARLDMEELKQVVDMDKVKMLKKKGVGFNFSIQSTLKFRGKQVLDMFSP